MRRWLRFEDRYSVSDIYCLYNNIEPTEKAVTHLDKCVIETGVSNPACLSVSKSRILSMEQSNTDGCVVFFDMDPVTPEDVMLTSEVFKAKAFKRDFVTYAPVVWCAETLACSCLGIHVDELLHPATEVARLLEDKRTKRLRDILNPCQVVDTLNTLLLHSKYNKKTLKVICSGELGYTYDETICFLDNLRQDVCSSLDMLWEKVPPSLRNNYDGNKEELLRQLGLL